MSEPKRTIVGAEEADVEVELTTQELRELSAAREHNERECGPIETSTLPPPKATGAALVSSARARQMEARPAQTRHVPISRLCLVLTLAVGATGAFYFMTAPRIESGQPMTQNILEQAPQSDRTESQPNVEGKPVHFVNPFDGHEVFEFPPGTSEAEARDAVAQLLLERAIQRQRQVDALVSKS